ncbi:MAG TPA: hypothetical protein PLR25_29710, partial [Planctomycetaceae bacterium]|nr:hypothetical protein [Planctomycetaceae bacterium]
KRVQLENQLRGRGDNRKKLHSQISDRVKYIQGFSMRENFAGSFFPYKPSRMKGSGVFFGELHGDKR